MVGRLLASELFNRRITHLGNGRGVLSAIVNDDNRAPARDSIYLSCALSTNKTFSPDKPFASGQSISNTNFHRVFSRCVPFSFRDTDNYSACHTNKYFHHT
jgi:hypothetical protein